MNTNDCYTVNRGNTEFPEWETAHWKGAGEIPSFHHMSLDSNGQVVLKHISAIKPMKPDTKPLEDEMRRLIEHGGLVPEARRLITAALQVQSTGKSEFSI